MSLAQVQLPSADMARCAACDPLNKDRRWGGKVHVCPRLANPDVKAELLAAIESGARLERWQRAVDGEVDYRYGVVGANVLAGGLRAFDVVRCGRRASLTY